MLITLIPLFDEKMSVSAYSIFSQKENFLLNPKLLGTGRNDGASYIAGLEVIQEVGIDTLAPDKEVFVQANNISIFSDIADQCEVPHERLVLLLDNSIKPTDIYINRIKELKDMGYRFAIRKLAIQDFEPYRDILVHMDYFMLDYKKINIETGKIYFEKVYPDMKLIAGNIESNEIFKSLTEKGGYQLYEGEFFRVPITRGEYDVSPIKINYIQLLNLTNSSDFELTKAADVIGQDVALTISLLKIVNKIAINSEITSIRHAAAMLGQRELKKWINTAVTTELYSDKPNEITKTSLIRAKFAENLSSIFGMAAHSAEMFLMGLFSVIDVILEMPMEEALKIITVSNEIKEALLNYSGKFAPVFIFMLQYEVANWQEVSRLMILDNINTDQVYDAYVGALIWYRDLISD